MSDNNIMKMIKGLGNGETLDEAIKEANEKVIDEVTIDEEVKEAEATEEVTTEEEIDMSGVDYDKLAEVLIAKQAEQDNSTGSEKVDNLVGKLNKEASDLAGSQEMIVTALFNEHCMEEGENAEGEDIAKLAEEEDSIVPYLVDCVYKYAQHADATLAEEYGDDYNEEDVIKMASVFINSVENPFELEEATEEFVEDSDELDKQARAILDKMAADNDEDTITNIVLDKIKQTITETSN
jgi:outer membrane protein OmpA-like peptidoglycan-associated protein